MSDRYADVNLPWVGVKVAATLCRGGPVKYLMKDMCDITDAWLAWHVLPHVAKAYSDDLAALLGKVMLWAAFDAEGSTHVQPALCHHILGTYSDLPMEGRFPVGENPVRKVRLMAYGQESIAHLDEVEDVAEDGPAGAGISVGERHAVTIGNLEAWLTGIHSQVSGGLQKMEEF